MNAIKEALSMRKGMLEANKRYFIRRKNDKSVLIEMNRTSAMIIKKSGDEIYAKR